MKIIEPGHIYEFLTLDKKPEGSPNESIVFVNREPGHEHPGTQTQEVLRALIDRTLHCDACLPHRVNEQIVYHLRMALILHEARALERKVEKGIIPNPESLIINGDDGHLSLRGYVEVENSALKCGMCGSVPYNDRKHDEQRAEELTNRFLERHANE